MANIKKAVAGAVTTAITGIGILISLNVLTGDAKNTAVAVLAVVTPVLTLLGVYIAPKNANT